MATQLDYAALSAIVYNNIRKQDNKLTLPSSWIELPIYPNALTSFITGFTARAYSNGTEIVIAYKGTDTANLVQTVQDYLFGNAAAIGGSVQLIQAALFYEQVKAQYGSNITFTGHSLGGGLASVMGVWFNKSATTFAETPFGAAASNPLAVAAVDAALASHLYFDSDILLFNPLNYAAREANITNYFVPGEVLNSYLSSLPSVVGTNKPIMVGGASLLPGSAMDNAITLHSMNLHAALLMSQTLRNDTVSLPNLLTEIFDNSLYARNLNTAKADFLTSLLNDQVKVGYATPNGLLARFAADLDKLTALGDNLKTGALSKAVIDAAIEDYYLMQTGFSGKDFFSAITGGISFDLADIGAGWSSKLATGRLDNAVITQLLNGDQTAHAFLAQDNAWSIQSGMSALTATGTGTNNDAMIGGIGGDTLDGGAGSDFLYGGAGADTLTGGAGDDMLIGGAGNDTMDGGAGYDTYTLEGRDTIRDSDGLGVLKDKAGNILSGIIQKNADGSYTYLNNPAVSVTLDAASTLTLTLADGTIAVVESFAPGNLGLYLADVATIPLTGDIVPTDFAPTVAGIQAQNDVAGNLIGTVQAFEDVIIGKATAEHIISGAMNDDVAGMAGNDWIEAGSGNDFVNGNAGDDQIEGGTGADILAGDAGNDLIYADAKIDAATAIANGNTDMATGLKGDWLSGNAGNDTLIVGASNDVLSGGGGNDTLIAGAGDDFILGDSDYTPLFIQETSPRFSVNGIDRFHSNITSFDWGVTRDASGTYVFAPTSGTSTTTPADGGADVIYAGDGADHVWAGAGNDIVMGEGGNDTLLGGTGANYIDGGAGNDFLQTDGDSGTLIGGAGDDTFVVDNASDVVIENLNEGTDTVQSSISYALTVLFEREKFEAANNAEGRMRA